MKILKQAGGLIFRALILLIVAEGPIWSFVTVTGFTDINAGLPSLDGSSLSWGDYDNDGDLDLVIAGYDEDGNAVTKLYRNDGHDIFTEINAGLTRVAYSSLVWGDYDNDGYLDLALTGETENYNNYNYSQPVSKIYHNNGDGTFTEINAGLTGVSSGSIAWGDYDNDGYLDLALTGSKPNKFEYDYFQGVSKIYHNNGDGTFTEINAGLTQLAFSSLVWGDYDNDGDLDLALAGWDLNKAYYDRGVSKIYRNDGGGVFTEINAGLTGVGWSSLAWGDYDNDGDLDLALAGYVKLAVYFSGVPYYYYGPVSNLYRNDGGGIFTEINAGLTGVYSGSLSWGDYDNDGNLDLALAGGAMDGSPYGDLNYYPVANIYQNNGGGIFTDIGAGLTVGPPPYSNTPSLSWGDYDQDGDLDLAMSGAWSKIYRNEVNSNQGGGGGGGGDTTAPGAITDLTATPGTNSGEINLNWTAVGDDGYSGNIANGQWRIAYSTDTNYNFALNDYQTALTTDTIVGQGQIYTVTGLTAGTSYYFAIWTADEVPNWSDISNRATSWLQIQVPVTDNVSPGAITDLTAIPGTNSGEINLNWTAVGDDGYNGDIVAGKYRIAYSSVSVSESVSNYNIELTTDTIPGQSHNYTLTGLTAGTSYYFAIWTADEVPNWSDISNRATSWLQLQVPVTDNVSPGAITDLTAIPGTNSGEINLNWTAVGDDGYSGDIAAGKYRIAYSSVSVSESVSNYNIELTTDTIVGQGQIYTVTGLTAGTSYYFAIWTADEVPNWSDISNIANSLAGGSLIISGNHPPEIPSNPYPADEANNLGANIGLSWECRDPEGDALNFDIYFGTNNPVSLIGNSQEKRYSLQGLSAATTYYWQIIATDSQGAVSRGPVWKFITGVSTIVIPPDPPIIDGGGGGDIIIDLPDGGGDPDNYDLYFGTTNPPGYLGNPNGDSYIVSGVEPATTYYWQIVVTDGQGFTLVGPVWSFITDNFSLYGDITGVSDFDQLLLLLLPANWGEDPVNIIPQDVHRREVNKQGRYSFTNLPPGEYVAYLVRKNNFKIIHQIPSLTIEANKANKLDITVNSPNELNVGTISGRISNRSGQSLESFVLLKDLKEQIIGLGVTDLGGNFRFAGLNYNRYAVFASADKYVVDKVAVAVDENKTEQEIKVVLYYPTIELSKDETVDGEDGVVRVEVPAATFARRTGIIIKKRSSGQDIEAANTKLKIKQDFWKEAIYEIRAVAAVYQENNNRMVNGKKAKIGFQYLKVNGYQPITGKTQQPWIHRLGGDSWTKVAGPQEADSSRGKVGTWVEEFSIFRILALAEENLSKFVVYPNPFKPNSRVEHKWIVFSGLTSRVKIEIFTLTGIKVREINKDDNKGSYFWDAQNGEGKTLASGIYIYLITNDNGEKKIGKIGIVK